MPEFSLPELSSLAAAGNPTLWLHGAKDTAEATYGIGEFARFSANGDQRFEVLQAQFRKLTAQLPAHTSGLRAFVSAAFSAGSQAASVLIVPRIQWQIADGKVRVIDLTGYLVGAGAGTGSVADIETAAGSVDAVVSPSGQKPKFASRIRSVTEGGLSSSQYQAAVREAVRQIEAGELAKTVLARDEVVTLDGAVPVGPLAAALTAQYPTCWTFYVDGLIGASPELLVRVRDGEVYSQALAGSTPVTGDLDLDQVGAADLLTSAKDTSEHAYAARSIIEVLRKIADVEVGDTKVLRLPTIMHLATEVTGFLTGTHSALQVAGLLHPSAAICGTPRAAAARVITELEGRDRGRYSGPVGWVDDSGNGEFAIALRCGITEPDTAGDSLRLFAGAGIVVGSDPATELAETRTKMLPMRRALDQVLT